MKRKLVIFDFDGTLTNKDTLLEILKFIKGKRSFYTGMILLSPMLLLYLLKIIPNYVAKQKMLAYYLKKYPFEKFTSLCEHFQKNILPMLINPVALLTMKEYLRQGDKVIVISASAENWIKDWSLQQGAEYIGTRLEVKNDRLTGKFSGTNCYGIEKVTRLNEKLDYTAFEEIHVYGDSKGDREILAIATHPFYKIF